MNEFSKSNPLVSVIIPTHNMAEFITQAIDTVLAQTYQNFELIIVDDVSTDQTPEVVASIRDPRLQFLRHEKNSGPSVARNTGICAAQGEFIALLDADDLWAPTKLAKQLKLFQQDPNLGVAYCEAHQVDESGEILRSQLAEKPWPQAGDEAFIRIARRDDFIHAPLSSMMVRQACFNEVGLFDEQIIQAEEWDWVFRIAYKWNISFVQEPLVYYRMTGYFTPEKRLKRRMQEAHTTIIERGFQQVNGNISSSLKQEVLIETLWKTALYWYAIKEPDKAQQNIEQIVAQVPGFFDFAKNPDLLSSIAYTAWELYDTITPINEALSFVDYLFTHPSWPISESSGLLSKRIKAEVCAICAFDSYPRSEVWRVWESVARAVIYDPSWVKNIGLLKLLVKVIWKTKNF